MATIGVTDTAAFARALRQRLEDLGMSQRDLGEEVARELGRRRPFAQGTVGGWLGYSPPDPETTFCIERCLQMRPGALSRLLGFLPVEAKSVRSVREAIDSDPALSADQRDMLRAAYDVAVRRSK